MATSSITALIVGLALGLLGLALVRQSWLKRQHGHTAIMVAGWALMAVAAVPFVVALGPDLGVTTAFIAPMLGAMTLMTPGMSQRIGAPAGAAASAPQARGRGYATLRTLGVSVLAGPFALGVTLIASIALLRITQVIGWSMPDGLLVVFLFAPIAWAGLAVASTLEAPLRWRTLSLAGLAALFAVLALCLPPVVS